MNNISRKDWNKLSQEERDQLFIKALQKVNNVKINGISISREELKELEVELSKLK